jgi:uncharacterized protein
MTTRLFLWRRLDQPGHDACRWDVEADGSHRLSGVAAFAEGARACQLRYEVAADAAFHTRSAHVAGHVGRRAVEIRLRALRGGRWQIDGVERPDLQGCIDVDLGFTPATNLLPVRRLALRTGQAAQAPAVYLDVPAMTLRVLPQRYRRLGRTTYDYESPSHGYRATLELTPQGAVVRYPGVFERETL